MLRCSEATAGGGALLKVAAGLQNSEQEDSGGAADPGCGKPRLAGFVRAPPGLCSCGRPQSC